MGNCYNIKGSPNHQTIDTVVKTKKMAELNNDMLRLDAQCDDPEQTKKGEETQKSRKTNVARTKDGTVVTTTVIQHSSHGFDDDGFDDQLNGFGKNKEFQKFEKEFDKFDKYENYPKKNIIGSNRNQIKESSDEDEDYQKNNSNNKDYSKPNLQDFINEALRIHNDLRSKHSSPPLKINKELNQIAQKYSETIARSGNFEHSDNDYKGDPLGENLYMCGGYKITGKEMSQEWYNEIKDYDFRKTKPSSGTGHFTQVVWANSQEVGFGFAKAKDGSYYGVANYYPAGNYQGEYAENVKPKKLKT